MKKVWFSVLILLVLSWSCGTVFAKEKGKGRGPRGGSVLAKKGQADANEAGKSAKGASSRKGSRKKTKDEEKLLEMERKVKERLDAAKGKGREHQLEMIQKKMAQEDEKHTRRAARLARIRELAVQEGKTDIVERVDKLRSKEANRWSKKRGILKARQERLTLYDENGRRRMPTKEEREKRKKKRERRARESAVEERGSEESTTDSNDG